MASGTISDVQRARRVLTFGVCGSGKSMLAQQIADRIGVGYVSIDDICWDPAGFRPRPRNSMHGSFRCYNETPTRLTRCIGGTMRSLSNGSM